MKDKKLEMFKWTEFQELQVGHITYPSKALAKDIAEHTNKLLAEKLAECPRVYGTYKPEHSSAMQGIFHTYKTPNDTHTAILFDIQPIQECEHINVGFDIEVWAAGTDWEGKEVKPVCKDCGKKLKPTGWEAI